MVEFRLKTEGTRCAGDIVHLPLSFILLLTIALAVGVTSLVTGKVARQEEAFQIKQQALEDEMNKKHPIVCLKRNIPVGWTITPADVELGERAGLLPIDALSDVTQAIGKKTKCSFATSDVICQHQIYLQR